jgi:hypothetical protein
MIHEYAIDPEAVVRWGKNRSDFRFIKQSFGLGQPRMMSEFPSIKNWRKQFRRAAEGADDNEWLRITELFSIITEKLIRRESEIYDGKLSWLENALKEDEHYPFKAIIASSSPGSCRNVLHCDEVGSSISSCWDVRTQVESTRNAQDMANAIAAMLFNCSKVCFIDPHFGPENERHRRPLKAFLEVIARRPCQLGPAPLKSRPRTKLTQTTSGASVSRS